MPRRLVQGLLGLAVSLVCGWLALRRVNLHDVADALRGARYVWLLPALAALAAGVLMRTERWRLLFTPEGRPSLGVTFWAYATGLFLNNVLPARAGEVARVLALNRETGIPRTQGLVTVVVERVFDLASLAILLLALVGFVPHTATVVNLLVASGVILVLTALLVGVLAIARLRPHVARLIHRLPVVGGARGDRTINSLGRGLSTLRRRDLAAPVLAWSLASWLALGLSNWLVLQAFPGIHAPWHAAVLALVTTNLAQVLPSSAGAIGVFEVAAKAALTAYGASDALALSYGLVLHAVNLVPYLVLGAFALGRIGLSGRELLRPGQVGGEGRVP